MYQQFALTIAISVLLSAFSALSLSPPSPPMLLKPAQARARHPREVLRRLQQGLRPRDQGYVKGAQMLVRRSIVTIGLVAVVAVGGGPLRRGPSRGFIPEETRASSGST
jgi:multidrug efflux pump subunit AcrB